MHQYRTSSSSRQEQRKARTRARLLQAAQHAVSQYGPHDVSVANITETADVGTGTFYNYFSSVSELLEVVAHESMETIGDALDRSVAKLADSAQVWSGSLRYLVRYALADQVWGWFFVNIGAAHPALMTTFGPRAHRDLRRGIDEQRFDIDDIDLVVSCAFGALISAVEHGLLNPSLGNHDQRYAKAMLQMVGIAPAEATQIAAMDIPALDLPAQASAVALADLEIAVNSD